MQRPRCPGDVSQSSLPCQTSLLPSTQGPFLGHLRAEGNLPQTRLSLGGTAWLSPPSGTLLTDPKSKLMLFWCLLGFPEQPFIVASLYSLFPT